MPAQIQSFWAKVEYGSLRRGLGEISSSTAPCLLRLFISRGLPWPPIKPPSWAPPRGARGRTREEIERQERGKAAAAAAAYRLKPSLPPSPPPYPSLGTASSSWYA